MLSGQIVLYRKENEPWDLKTLESGWINWSYGRREEWDNDFYPPVVALSEEEKALVTSRWQEYGLEPQV